MSYLSKATDLAWIGDSITPEIVKNLRRGETVTVQKWTVTDGQWSPSVC